VTRSKNRQQYLGTEHVYSYTTATKKDYDGWSCPYWPIDD